MEPSMDFLSVTLKVANAIVTLFVVVFLCLAGAYSGYALWDNARVYSEAEDIQSDMISLMPVTDESQQEPPSFDELLAINQDVCAWIALDGTKISYPVLYGETNMTYINTDIYGSFSLAGSIFLDSRNDPGFGDFYSMLHGHHMVGGRMFGDLDRYKEKKFFDENTAAGVLMTPAGTYNLELYACLVVPASDDVIFRPGVGRGEIDRIIGYAAENAMYIRQEAAQVLAENSGAKLLALSTCSSEFTDARTVVLVVMIPQTAEQSAL